MIKFLQKIVPVLYFNAYNVVGKLLSRNEILQDLPIEYKNKDEELNWSFISQMEHPYLQLPFYFIHPCETSTLLSELLNKKEMMNKFEDAPLYIKTWFSLISRIFQFPFPSSLFNKNENHNTKKKNSIYGNHKKKWKIKMLIEKQEMKKHGKPCMVMKPQVAVDVGIR